MKRFGFCALLLLGLFHFSEGKPCPARTRAHKTRCEFYYKCIELPSQMHVWVPAHCDTGLVYEANLRVCVLPGDDWECRLGDADALQKTPAAQSGGGDNNNNTQDIHIVSAETLDDGEDSEEYEASGDGALVELDGYLPAEDRQDALSETTLPPPATDSNNNNSTVSLPPQPMEMKTTPSATEPTKIDPQLTEHLQRLSQLIDGLKQTYQSHDQPQHELRPDQLNAFLAHFNIKNKFDTLPVGGAAGDDGYAPTPLSSTTAAPALLLQASRNKTLLQEHLTALPAETKLMLSAHAPSRYGSAAGEYSNSQIVVNRPEGSVLFNLPPTQQSYSGGGGGGSEMASQHYGTPKISEETLKTVLELSKQMIANQNVPKIIPNGAAAAYYAQPYLQPLYLQPPPGVGNPFTAYYGGPPPHGAYGARLPQSHHRKPSRPHNTIIHNVIPVHVAPSGSGEKDSYGHNLALYPPLGVDETGGSGGGGGTVNHLHHHSHRYESNKYITSVVTTALPLISSSTELPPGGGAQYTATTARPPSAATIAEYYTPSPHLSDSNVNSLFHAAEPQLYATPSTSLPRPMQQPAQQYGGQLYQPPSGHSALFPPPISANKVKIRPNAQKVESVEMLDADDDDGAVDYATGYNPPPPPPRRHQPHYHQPPPQIMTYNYDSEKPDVSDQLASHSHALSAAAAAYGAAESLPPPPPSLAALLNGQHGTPSNPHYMPRPSAAGRPQQLQQHASTTAAGSQQLINVGGNFISYDVFQQSILPLLGGHAYGQAGAQPDLSNVEVITCTPGVRQPNATDCTRYYVCSKKDGKVLSYSCPPYTAFNEQSRICDARTYAQCSGEAAIVAGYSVAENKRLQLEALQALHDAKRRRQQQQQQAVKAQSINNLLSQFGTSSVEEQNAENASTDSGERDLLGAYMQQAALMGAAATSTSTTTARPPGKKRKYYCKDGDKIADQASVHSYFVCYKNALGTMKGHRMSCSKGLIFCPKSTMCTLASKCA